MTDLPILTTRNYKSVLSKKQHLVMLTFDAGWASSARDVIDIARKLEVVNAGRLFVARLCIDSEPDLARGLGVTSLPRVLFLLKGKKVGSIAGLRPRTYYQRVIDSLLDFAENSSHFHGLTAGTERPG